MELPMLRALVLLPALALPSLVAPPALAQVAAVEDAQQPAPGKRIVAKRPVSKAQPSLPPPNAPPISDADASAGAKPVGPRKLGTSEPIDDATWDAMQGKSWRPKMGCPTREKLALLKVPYIDFAGVERTGEMIVAAASAADVLGAFAELYRARFPVASMRLIDKFAGNDIASMAANNTSAFNCRAVTGGTRLSEHSFGTAIDLNPIQNPYVTGSRTLPAAGIAFSAVKARLPSEKGLVTSDDVVVKAFARIGWSWGGNWGSPKDYQHFSKSGR
jgi:D-alanyl-D-alanine carboxypeptidase